MLLFLVLKCNNFRTVVDVSRTRAHLIYYKRMTSLVFFRSSLYLKRVWCSPWCQWCEIQQEQICKPDRTKVIISLSPWQCSDNRAQLQLYAFTYRFFLVSCCLPHRQAGINWEKLCAKNWSCETEIMKMLETRAVRVPYQFWKVVY